MKNIRLTLVSLILLMLAGVCFWIPHHLKQPGRATHKLLIATGRMNGSPLDKAVILVLQQNTYGATGLVLNHPAQKQGDPRIGGPLEQNIHYALHSLDLSSADTVRMPEMNTGATKGETFLLLIGHMGDKPQEHMILNGYAGWGLMQLDHEIDAGAWKVVTPNSNFIFHTAPENMWDAAMKLPPVKPQ